MSAKVGPATSSTCYRDLLVQGCVSTTISCLRYSLFVIGFDINSKRPSRYNSDMLGCMVNEWIAVLAAATGAGGAIFAQIFGSIFTARREAKRLKWEKETKQLEWNFKRAERFLDLKRELYSRYLSLTYKPISDLSLKLNEEFRAGEYQTLDVKATEYIDELDDLRWNLQLIAPGSISSGAEVVYAAIFATTVVYYRPDEYSQEHRKKAANDTLDSWQEMKHLMRSDLDSTPDALEAQELFQREIRAGKDRVAKDHVQSKSKFTEDLDMKIDKLRDGPDFFPQIYPHAEGRKRAD